MGAKLCSLSPLLSLPGPPLSQSATHVCPHPRTTWTVGSFVHIWYKWVVRSVIRPSHDAPRMTNTHRPDHIRYTITPLLSFHVSQSHTARSLCGTEVFSHNNSSRVLCLPINPPSHSVSFCVTHFLSSKHEVSSLCVSSVSSVRLPCEIRIKDVSKRDVLCLKP